VLSFSYTYKVKSCELCGMDINDSRFLARAETVNDKMLHFDATECLVNYLKENNANINEVWVANYKTKKQINAKTAFYLKSKNLPSPMGAFISAYPTEDDAKAMQNKKDGEVYNWEELKAKFRNSRFGSLDEIQINASLKL
jgi:copper chaperone NosL